MASEVSPSPFSTNHGMVYPALYAIMVSGSEERGPDLVIDALEQIDVSYNLIEKYSDDFQVCKTADDVEQAIRDGKIASLFGLEGLVPNAKWNYQHVT